MPSTKKKLIERMFDDGRPMIPFITVKDGIIFGEEKVAQQRAAKLSLEEEVNRRVEQELLKRGITDPSEMSALSFTELASQVYGTNNGSSDDAMLQITEDSRDVSPSNGSKDKGEINIEHGAAVAKRVQTQSQKKESRGNYSQEKDSKEKVRGEIEAGVREISKDMPNEERAMVQENANREMTQEAHFERRNMHTHDKGTEPRTSKGQGKFAHIQKEKTEQNKERAPRIKVEQQVVAKETRTVRANDYEGHDVKKTKEHVKAKVTNMDRGAGFGDLGASLARGLEITKAGNLLTAAVNITAQTGRTTEFLQGNNKLQLRRDPTDGCTYAFINDKKVGGDQAKEFILKMNKELGPEKAEQLKNLVDLARNNPNLDKNIGQAQKQTKSHDMSGRG